MRPGLRLAALVVLISCAPTACSEEVSVPPGDARRGWPEGTVLAVEDLPVTAAEVDAASIWIERIDRKASPDHLRRLALTNIVLRNKVARLLAPQARERALGEARQALARLREGSWSGPLLPGGVFGERRSGNFQRLGIPVWGSAIDLAEGEWSEPVEVPGQFLLLRRLALAPAPVPLAIEVELDVLGFPYLDPDRADGEVEAAFDRFHLTVVDPSWRPLVPELIQYRMGVHGP